MTLLYSTPSLSGNFSCWRAAFQKDAALLFQDWGDAETRGWPQRTWAEWSFSFEQEISRRLNRNRFLKRHQNEQCSNGNHWSSVWDVVFLPWSWQLSILMHLLAKYYGNLSPKTSGTLRRWRLLPKVYTNTYQRKGKRKNEMNKIPVMSRK